MSIFQNRPGFPSPDLNSQELILQQRSEIDQASARYESQLEVLKGLLPPQFYEGLLAYFDSRLDETLLPAPLMELMDKGEGELGKELSRLVGLWIERDAVDIRFTVAGFSRSLAELDLSPEELEELLNEAGQQDDSGDA